MSQWQTSEAIVDTILRTEVQSVELIGNLPLKVGGHCFTKEYDPEQLMWKNMIGVL